MSVYKEGYYAIRLITSNTRQIFPNACDYGVPTRKGDQIWKITKRLVDWYGVKGTRRESKYITGTTVSQIVELMSESTGRVDRFKVTYVTTHDIRDYDGYVEVEVIV